MSPKLANTVVAMDALKMYHPVLKYLKEIGHEGLDWI
jgi:hypothetical protein